MHGARSWACKDLGRVRVVRARMAGMRVRSRGVRGVMVGRSAGLDARWVLRVVVFD